MTPSLPSSSPALPSTSTAQIRPNASIFSVIRSSLRLTSNVLLLIIDRGSAMGMRVLGKCLMVAAIAAILLVSYAFFAEVSPYLEYEHGRHSAFVYATWSFALFGIFQIFFHYFAAQILGPGYAPSSLPADIIAHLAYDPETPPGSPYRHCDKCDRPKPMRAHHCSICNACVLKMDHHCPWFNTCVGYKNHAHFILFLVWLWIMCIFFLFMSPLPVLRVMIFGQTTQAPQGSVYPARMIVSSSVTLDAQPNPSRILLTAFVLAVSAAMAMFLFLAWNMYLLTNNLTTLEFYDSILPRRPMPQGVRARSITRSRYDLGLVDNLRSVFGDRSLLAVLFIPAFASPPGNGLVFSMPRFGLVDTFTQVSPMDNNTIISSSSSGTSNDGIGTQHTIPLLSQQPSHSTQRAPAAYSASVVNGVHTSAHQTKPSIPPPPPPPPTTTATTSSSTSTSTTSTTTATTLLPSSFSTPSSASSASSSASSSLLLPVTTAFDSDDVEEFDIEAALLSNLSVHSGVARLQ